MRSPPAGRADGTFFTLRFGVGFGRTPHHPYPLPLSIPHPTLNLAAALRVVARARVSDATRSPSRAGGGRDGGGGGKFAPSIGAFARAMVEEALEGNTAGNGSGDEKEETSRGASHQRRVSAEDQDGSYILVIKGGNPYAPRHL